MKTYHKRFHPFWKLMYVSLFLMLACESFENLNLVFTLPAENPNSTSAQVEGIITDFKSPILQHGHCYSLNPLPTVNDLKTQLGTRSETGNFLSVLTGLNPSTLYYVRAYLITDEEIKYGNQITLQTREQNTGIKDFRVETDARMSNLSQQSAITFGTLVTEQSINITQYGHVWDTQPNPNLSNQLGKTELGTLSISNNREFSSNLTGLSASTTYYRCAYAIDSDNIIYYGQVHSFTTPNN